MFFVVPEEPSPKSHHQWVRVPEERSFMLTRRGDGPPVGDIEIIIGGQGAVLPYVNI